MNLRDESIEEVTAEVTAEVERLLLAITVEMSRQQIQAVLMLKHAEHFRSAYPQCIP